MERAYSNPPESKSENSNPPVTFNLAFIERRLREHRQWQEREMHAACLEVFEEVELAQELAADHIARDIRRSPLFRIRYRRAIHPALLRANKAGV
jgi:ribosomal protein S3